MASSGCSAQMSGLLIQRPQQISRLKCRGFVAGARDRVEDAVHLYVGVRAPLMTRHLLA